MEIAVAAYGKINLFLDVIGKLENGYHEVDMVMQRISLRDVIHLEKRDSGIEVLSDHAYLPVDENNLAYQGARRVREALGLRGGVRIRIEKHIPVAAGLAGGSADAAAVIEGMNALYGLGLSREAMMALGGPLGADVPFCFLKGAARARGIGQDLTPVKGLGDVYLVLTKPNLSVSTREIYENLTEEDCRDHGSMTDMLQALEEENIYRISRSLFNTLERVTLRRYPGVLQEKKRMISYGARGVLMSGSGPTILGLFNREGPARAAAKNFKRFNQQTYLVRPF
jgi:4-diphosphocytidyl-2-C-methyl-D-erythritol kinase